MPDTLICPRCNTDLLLADSYLLFDSGFPDEPDKYVYRCPCGPLCVVEGESVKWYYPRAWLKALGRLPRVQDALIDEAADSYRRRRTESRS